MRLCEPQFRRGRVTFPLMTVTTSLEQLPATFHLRIVRILDLQPRRAAPIALIRAVLPFRHNALQIALAREPKESATPFDNSIQV